VKEIHDNGAQYTVRFSGWCRIDGEKLDKWKMEDGKCKLLN
jgi:hypothetical protein